MPPSSHPIFTIPTELRLNIYTHLPALSLLLLSHSHPFFYHEINHPGPVVDGKITINTLIRGVEGSRVDKATSLLRRSDYGPAIPKPEKTGWRLTIDMVERVFKEEREVFASLYVARFKEKIGICNECCILVSCNERTSGLASEAAVMEVQACYSCLEDDARRLIADMTARSRPTDFSTFLGQLHALVQEGALNEGN
ncbi:hypothetical protein BJ508DRAFT_346218 [Ascobolus immersus RN42]|uniref:F-box domain-containing protein n=1 Tax=Ascobolus immersus RN42 TaxID=1160509 RepID=A0A3N4I982_ASCIM|nr:hypothetical protein BJ508DRAFT_346218 [Ascobolus immersus RN42]